MILVVTKCITHARWQGEVQIRRSLIKTYSTVNKDTVYESYIILSLVSVLQDPFLQPVALPNVHTDLAHVFLREQLKIVVS